MAQGRILTVDVELDRGLALSFRHDPSNGKGRIWAKLGHPPPLARSTTLPAPGLALSHEMRLQHTVRHRHSSHDTLKQSIDETLTAA